MYYVYILSSARNFKYVGSTEDLKKRVEQHNRGSVNSTSKYLPLNIIWYGCFKDKQLALKFELYLKSSSGQAFRNKRLII